MVDHREDPDLIRIFDEHESIGEALHRAGADAISLVAGLRRLGPGSLPDVLNALLDPQEQVVTQQRLLVVVVDRLDQLLG